VHDDGGYVDESLAPGYTFAALVRGPHEYYAICRSFDGLVFLEVAGMCHA
jgi:hypothetical protein